MDISLSFMHPTDGRLLNVKLDSSITAQEAIAELISKSFVPTSEDGYALAVKGGTMLSPNDTFE